MGQGRNGGCSDEAPTPSKRHRRRKEVNSPRSVLFKSLYRAEGETREWKRKRSCEREAEDAAQLNCPWRAWGRERSAKDSVIYLWPSRAGGKEEKWGMNRALMKSHSPICLASFSPGMLHSSRNLPTELESLHEVPIAIIERSILQSAPSVSHLKKNRAPSLIDFDKIFSLFVLCHLS